MTRAISQTPVTSAFRSSDQRGHMNHGWLDAKHTFSFGRYTDPHWMGFRSLRVINEDQITPRMGFSEHPHRNMEIISYPISGAIRHRDSLGHSEDITPGMIQHMSAGSGIRHSELNPRDEPTHMLQIWIEPREQGLTPVHQSRAFPVHDEPGTFHLLASPDGVAGSITIQQDARMLAGTFAEGDSVTHPLELHEHAWVQIVRGGVRVGTHGNEKIHTLGAGDGLAISGASALKFEFLDDTELIVFELN
jgi:redox-sensitive bicupin YhaK (pirin superfamily)